MASSATISAPTGGLYTVEPWANADTDTAIIMDNFFPDGERVRLRKGSEEYVAGLGADVETLMTYVPEAQAAAAELYAAADKELHSITNPAAVTVVADNLTNDRWNWTQFGTSGGQFLIAVNSADTPLLYDGTTWGNTSITGPTQSQFSWVHPHHRRLWFGLRDSLTVYHLAVEAIAGAATAFELGPLAARGGRIIAMGTWTRDSGAGPDDVAVFVSSEGELFVYAGIDPTSALSWGLIGVFTIGRPVSERCLIKFGGDLLIVTEEGVIPMSVAALMDQSRQEITSVSRNIRNVINKEVINNRVHFGWQLIIHDAERQMILNVPTSGNTSRQYAWNTVTGAAARFTGWNAKCWVLWRGDLYFGTPGGRVVRANTGSTDEGAAIVGDCLQAFNHFGNRGMVKHVKRVKPIFYGEADPNVAVQVHADFEVVDFASQPVQVPHSSALWDQALWDEAVWAGDDQIFAVWIPVVGKGRALAIRVKVATTTGNPEWAATMWTYTRGGTL